MMEPAGGVDQFLEDHAVIVMADHSQAPMSAAIELLPAADLEVLGPDGRGVGDGPAQVAICPSQRAAMIYVLEQDQRDALRPAIVRDALALDGVELATWLERDAGGAPREGASGVTTGASCGSRQAASCSTCADAAGASRAISA